MCSFSLRLSFVTSMYERRALTGQSFKLSAKLEYSTSRGGPDLLVLDNPGTENLILSGCICIYLRSNKWRSDALSALDKAISMTVFKVSSLKERSPRSAIDSRCNRTSSISHISEYLGSDGRSLNTPCISRQIIGCFPVGYPSM